jgi:putative DNA primase/helicase
MHRTYLADVKPRKMFLPGGLPKGGAIRLSDLDLCLGIAEGIETALSASILFHLPVWATTSDWMLRNWQPPRGVKHITIFGDNDSSFAGQRAAYDLAFRLARGFNVTVEIPPTPDTDWNDALKEQGIQICRNCGFRSRPTTRPQTPIRSLTRPQFAQAIH